MASPKSIPVLTGPDIDRFWSYVNKTETCWLWVGTNGPAGYGCFWLNHRQYRSHRLSFALAGGQAGPMDFVCHTCDVRKCVNPAHLFAGSHRDNIRDAAAKGRMTRGERHAKTRVNSTIVMEMREQYASGVPLREMERTFGMCNGSVRHIVIGDTWKHLPLIPLRVRRQGRWPERREP